MWLIIFLLQTFTNIPPASTGQVPVLCYHNLAATGTGDRLHATSAAFRRQLQALRDAGYHTPDPSLLSDGASLPPKSIFITFDDSHADHFLIAAPALEEAGFRGIFFIMTVTIGKKGFLTSSQIKTLHEHGHWIGSHTWDHPRLSARGFPDAAQQLSGTKSSLERITGAPVTLFAYPYGFWNDTIAAQVKKAGYKAAFQLSETKMSAWPQFSIRRIMVDGRWNGEQLLHAIDESFK
ncbi:polysaccharide deacetylase family protein [Chitinophaga pollutisoli]|uniref:Polysaccharide deacetylase family protein n=1 Tax=Chitinophaga pollutisoli TaxID=3133966 RepID=A0ABZ2YLZ4_9BACT